MRLPVLLLATVVFAGCSTEAPPTSNDNEAASAPAEQAAWILEVAPDGATEVAELKKTAKEGDSIVVRGIIGGSRAPIIEGAAVFTVMDRAVPDCSAKGDDHCKYPWDYCCETPESKVANSATIQVVGEDGKPLAIDVGPHGLAPSSDIIVVGTVGPRPNDAVLVINASGIHIAG